VLAQDSDRDGGGRKAVEPIRRASDGPDRQRKVIHIDMDAFFASVEQRDNPELRGKPVAVGGSRERGVVAAASYEAREFGVHSAMPSATAKRKCPNLIFVKPRFDVYRAVSLQIRAIFAEYTPVIEPLSLDEAYLDVTENLKGIVSATQIAETIRAKIRTETGLTASAGVSYNKYRWPLRHYTEDGTCPRRKLPVEKFHGGGSEDESARDQNRVRPQRADACLPSAALRGAWAILLLDCARCRRTACPSRPDPQVSWCGKHLFRRYLHIRGRMRGDTESEICMTLSSLGEKQLESEPQLRLSL